MQVLAKVWVSAADAWSAASRSDPNSREWRKFREELSEPVLQRVLQPTDIYELAFLDMCNPWVDDKPKYTQIETNVFSNIMQVAPPCPEYVLPAQT